MDPIGPIESVILLSQEVTCFFVPRRCMISPPERLCDFFGPERLHDFFKVQFFVLRSSVSFLSYANLFGPIWTNSDIFGAIWSNSMPYGLI